MRPRISFTNLICPPLTLALAAGLLVGCPKAPEPAGPAGPDAPATGTAAIPTAEVPAPTATADATADPAATATATAEPPDAGDMSEEQRNALATLRAAKTQDPRKFDDATDDVLKTIGRELSLTGLTRGQLIRALGEPNKPLQGKASPDRASWTIGKLPGPMPLHPPVLEVEFDADGKVKAVGVRRSR